MADASTSDTELETRADALSSGGEAKYWQIQLELSDKDHDDWIKDGKSVSERYNGGKDKKNRGGKKRFNILYSNVEVLKAQLLGRVAKPDVRRRFTDQDPDGRICAEIIERALIYIADTGDSGEEDTPFEAGLEDYLLPGRGLVKICYEATTGQAEDQTEYVAKQELYDDYVNWEDFRHEPTGKWKDVTWEAFCHQMSRDDLQKNFGENLGEDVVKTIPLNWSPDSEKNKNKVPEAYKKAEVWEIWDKTTKTRIWIVKGFDKPCRKEADPYGLEGFFPNRAPLYATKTNDSLIPDPEFNIYKDQADQLDEIETRKARLTAALKRRGVYNATITELKKLATAGDNEFIPVTKFTELQASGGLEKAFESEDVSKIAQILVSLHEHADLQKQTIYEVVGIGDIMRGSSDPRETLGAQKLKAQFGGNRLKKRQDMVQIWIRETHRLKAEIIAEHFEPQKLAEMTGFTWDPNFTGIDPQTQQPIPTPERTITPKIMQILRSDRLRSYRIDIETDSTVYEDAEAEKTARVELVTAMTQFVAGWAPVLQMQPLLMPMAFEMLAFAVRGFKTGRNLEEVLEQTKIQLEQAAQQPQQQPQEDPAVQVKRDEVQAKMQADTQQHQEKMAQADRQHQEKMVQSNQQHTERMVQGDRQLQADKEKQQKEFEFKDKSHKLAVAGQNKQLLEETQEPGETEDVAESLKKRDEVLSEAMLSIGEALKAVAESQAIQTQAIVKAVSAPKEVTVQRGRNGQMTGASLTPATVN